MTTPRSRTLRLNTALAFGGAAVAIGTTVALSLRRKVFQPRIVAQPTQFNQAILDLCHHLREQYHLPAFLHNGHVETIFAALFRQKPHVLYDREILHMPDGGVVALDTEHSEFARRLPPTAPVLLLLPGLTGGSEDTYVQHAVVHAREAGLRAVVFNSRGTSGSPVRTAQFYSASYTEDLRHVIAHVANKHPDTPLFAAGWSLGANILCRYLGEEGENTPIAAAVSMCNPFDLVLANDNFERGFNRIYDANLARSLRRHYTKYHQLFVQAAAESGKPYNPDLALRASTIREFDEAITRVSFDWPSVDAYYAGSSSSLSIPNVAIPLLVIQAEDDPIAPKEGIPFETLEANPHCITVLTPSGGHLGWCSGEQGVMGAPWTDKAVAQYFQAIMRMGVQPGATVKEDDEGVYSVRGELHQAP